MNKPTICFLLFGAFLAVGTADAPLPFYALAVPAPVYGVPKAEPLPAPIVPAPVYGIPKILAPAPAPIIPAPVYGVPKILAPAPAPIIPAPVYGVPKIVEIIKPVVKSSYSYEIPPQPIVKVYAAPAPVYGLPKIHVPAPVYGIPKIALPAKPVLTTYEYQLPVVKPVEIVAKLAPYPAPFAVAPHAVYGVPAHL